MVAKNIVHWPAPHQASSSPVCGSREAPRGGGRRDAQGVGCSMAPRVLLQEYCKPEVYNNRGAGEQAVPSPSYPIWSEFSDLPWNELLLDPQPFKKPLFQKTSVTTYNSLEFHYSHWRMNALPLLGKTLCLCCWETMSQLAQGKEEEARKSPFLCWIFPHFLLFLFWAHWFWSCGLFSAWLSVCENCSFPKRDHLLVLIWGDSIPRLSPSRTKGIIFHLHSKWSMVSWGD